MMKRLLCYSVLVILCLKDSVLLEISTELDKCNIRQPTRGILDLKQPLNPAKLLNETSAFSLRKCSEICCRTVKCNAYIWRNSAQCFLFYCKIEKDCKVVPYQGTVTGFVSKKPILQSSAEDIARKTKDVQLKPGDNIQNGNRVSNEHEDEPQFSGQSMEQSPSNEIKPLQNDKQNKGNIAVMARKEEDEDNLKRASKGFNLTSTTSTTERSVTTNTTTKRGTSEGKGTQPVPVLNSSLASQKVSHTTTTSLIAALAFGTVFFAAVAFLIGKPWWQQFCSGRDGYNRVTFLMNGT